MSTVAFIRRMLDAGFSHDDALRAAEAHEATVAERIVVDPQAERRREKDRVRHADRRERLRMSADSADSADIEDAPPPLSPSPQTPQPHTPPPGENTPREGVPARGPTRAQIASGFLAFWAAYPKRKAKDAAAKAFAKAMARITDPDPLAVILAGIERALPGWANDDPKWIPYPATWLNDGSWDDEASTRQNGPPRHDRTNRPDKTAERHENYANSWAGFEGADQVLASRRTF